MNSSLSAPQPDRRGAKSILALPSVTVVMPNYNHSRFLKASISAIVNQSHPPDRFLIIDDASTDDSWALISRLAKQYPLIEARRNEVNLGAVKSLELGFQLTSTEYILFSAADDLVAPDLLRRSLELLSQHPMASLCSALSMEIDEDGRSRGLYRSPIIATSPIYLPPQDVIGSLLRYDSWIMGNTTVYRKAALEEIGGFPHLRGFSDGAACIKMGASHGLCFIPAVLGAWRRMGTGIAMQTFRNTESALEMIPPVKDYLRHGPGSALLLQYVDQWERVWRYFTAISAGGEDRKSWVTAVQLAIGASNAVDYFVLLLLRNNGFLGRSMIKFYLFIRLRGWRPLLTKLRLWLLAKRSGISKANAATIFIQT